MMRLSAPLAAMLLLSGCSFGPDGLESGLLSSDPTWAVAQVEVVSLVATKKTVVDHLAGFVSGKDCSSPRYYREGQWCREHIPDPAPPPEVYCYASIAKPTCYTQPYTEGNDRLLGYVPASTPRVR